MRVISISLMFLTILFSVSYLFRFAFILDPILLNCSFHFLGGFFSARLIADIWKYYSSGSYYLAKKERIVYVGMVFGAIALGTSWEVFEYPFFAAGIFENRTSLDLYTDTILDLLMDTVGGISAVLFLTAAGIFGKVPEYSKSQEAL